MMGWHDGGASWAGWLLMSVLMVAFWALVIFGAIAVYRNARQDGRRADKDGGAGEPSSAERLLDERLARGEIDSSEYTERRNLLRPGR